MGLNDTFGFAKYISDDGNEYAVKLSLNVASEGGFTGPFSPLTNKVWPYHAKNMRHVYGKDGDGHVTRLPLADQGNSKYVSGGTFTIGARSYTIEGAIGEKRKLNSIA